MPERVVALPVRTRHRGATLRTRVVDVTATLGSGVAFAALVVVGATTATTAVSTAVTTEPDAPLVTFRYAQH